MIQLSNIKLNSYVYMRHEAIPHPIAAKVVAVEPRDDGDCVIVEIILHNIGLVTVKCEDIYATADELKEAEYKRDFDRYYEETSTINGLLKFLQENEMLASWTEDNVMWDVLNKRLDEAGLG